MTILNVLRDILKIVNEDEQKNFTLFLKHCKPRYNIKSILFCNFLYIRSVVLLYCPTFSFKIDFLVLFQIPVFIEINWYKCEAIVFITIVIPIEHSLLE